MIKTKNEAEMGPRNIIVPGAVLARCPLPKQLNYMPIKHSDAVRNTYLTFGVGKEGGRGGEGATQTTNLSTPKMRLQIPG